MYEVVISIQFLLETEGYTSRLITDGDFKDVKLTLDNIMKEHTQQGLGNSVRQAEVLTLSDEDIFVESWSIGD